ncbi:MAG: MBL fold metallo-hydrolase [Oscillospiraceae bacterium]|nr:MBL fold metallo-hydrolase [Oscillospiraceae bacterium]
MAQRKRTSSRKNTETFGISPVLLFLLILMGAAFCFSLYLEFGDTEVPASAVSSFIDKDADLEIHYIDVGQGDCSLIKWEGAAVLIDCGERENSDKILDYLKKQDVKKLDIVIATHPHSDHIGGMGDIISGIDVERVIAPKVSSDKTPTTKTYERFLTAMHDKALKLTAAKPGTVYALAGKTASSMDKQPPKLEILAPVADYDDLNDYSVVVRMTYGDTSYLFTGDAEAKAEKDILNSGADVSADVLKAGHHGSSTSTSEKFLEAVSPDICVIQCGTGNSYGHPHAEILERLDSFRVKYFRTDINGTVIVYSDGDDIFVVPEKEQ